MSGRSYTPVELPRETLEDIQRQTDAELRALRSQLVRVAATAVVPSRLRLEVGRLVKAETLQTAAAVVACAPLVEEQLATAGATEARERLQAAAAQIAAPRPAATTAEDHDRELRVAVSRYKTAEARALEELAETKMRHRRLVEVATALAKSRPRGVEVLGREFGEDGSVKLAFSRPGGGRPPVDVTVRASGDAVQVAADATDPIELAAQHGAECVGLDQVWTPIIENARAANRLRVTGPTREQRLRGRAARLGGIVMRKSRAAR